MHTVNLNEARMMVKGEDGEWLTLRPAEDHFVVGDQTAFMPKMVITIKAHSEGLNRMLEVARGPSTFPITIPTLAIAAYDVIDAEITDDMTQDEADDFFKRSDAAKLAIGDAFALDTADRNEFEVARSWAAFNVDRTREFVTHLINPTT